MKLILFDPCVFVEFLMECLLIVDVWCKIYLLLCLILKSGKIVLEWYTVHDEHDEEDDPGFRQRFWFVLATQNRCSCVRIGLESDWFMHLPCARFHWSILVDHALTFQRLNETLRFIQPGRQYLNRYPVRFPATPNIQMPCLFFHFPPL